MVGEGDGLGVEMDLQQMQCTKFNFGWGFTADPTGEAYSAPQTL